MIILIFFLSKYGSHGNLQSDQILFIINISIYLMLYSNIKNFLITC